MTSVTEVTCPGFWVYIEAFLLLLFTEVFPSLFSFVNIGENEFMLHLPGGKETSSWISGFACGESAAEFGVWDF